MNVTCTQCQTVFRVDPAKVPEAGVRARCSVCAGVFWVRREAESAASTAPIAAPVAAPMVAATIAAPLAPRPAPAPAPTPAARPAAAPMPATAPIRTAPPAVAPTAAPPGGLPPFRPATPPAPAFRAPPAAPPAPAMQPAAAVSPPPAPPRPAPPPATAPAAAPAPTAVPRRRPTNPFLSQNPEARARRLARALVSDIVVYHPAKRRDALRDGSLKLLFEEEIRKSWDEYVDQVGRELADSTTFFTDALNEILADGQPLFP